VSALTPLPALALPILFIHTGESGSGSIGGAAFVDRAFTITATGDTDDRQSFGGGFFIDHLSASISIDGVGVFNFVTATRTFFNDTFDIPGFSRAGLGGLDLYNGPIDAFLDGWDMLSSIGPVPGSISLLQWLSSPVITDGGQLIFDNATTTGTFQAIVGQQIIPEPATVTLFTMALMGAAGYRLRRRMKLTAA
jgi:hypothetical protein